MSAPEHCAVPAPEAALAIRCRGLVVRYGDLTAVDGLDLDVRRGECFGLLGPNGAGKTTTVEVFEGLIRPDAGEVTVLGERWRGHGSDQRLRSRIGVALQETRLPEELTVGETVRLFRSFYPQGRRPDEVVELLGLEEKRTARVGRLSGGQRQRLALACALVGAPELLFLDEPTTGLDPQARLRIWEVVRAFLAAGGTVLLTTHYMDEAAHLAQRIAVIDHGRLLALDTPVALIDGLGAGQVIELNLGGVAGPELFAELDEVRHAERRGEQVALLVEDLARALPQVLGRTQARGVEVRMLTTHRATLDDVFVRLTGRGLRDA